MYFYAITNVIKLRYKVQVFRFLLYFKSSNSLITFSLIKNTLCNLSKKVVRI